MALVTIYCVQPFWNDGRKLAHCTLQQFTDRAAAMRAGERAAWRGAGAVVYSLEGDPEREDWGRPQFLARLGDVPEIGF